ncbi:hypothetical protein [Secundilactobacillus silagei]|uniref:AP2/ERF domain-containing protein n=1 Tax=Secundilactobacillus silagei JCM 19001 TaxID=1302250 RepID=A0A1Z5H4A3_9LACO|nr:hypothetical protein [Secundilactobacillus silagei]TDG70480.1 hypothetical protein C5L25_001670 [Secundilactobacillus silagei JCM 19001]GAT17749.1 hypothetical protein IWT126_00005 [Secundilactobacillus silagei JCM 19001]
MKRINLINQRFGRLIVIGFAGKAKNGNALWQCRCDCGQEVVVDGYLLRKGNTRSCGCIRRERGREAMRTNEQLIANRGDVNNLQQVNGTSVVAIMKKRKTNKSGVAGVSFDKRSQRWVARLMIRGQYVLNHSFDTFNEAVTARKDAVENNLGEALVQSVKVGQ